MIQMELDKQDVQNMVTRLGDLATKTPIVIKSAVNKTAKDVYKQLKKDAKKTYTFQNWNDDELDKFKAATIFDLTAEEKTQNRSQSPEKFKLITQSQGAKIKVMKKDGYHTLRASKSNGGNKAFKMNVKSKCEVVGNTWMARASDKRYPIVNVRRLSPRQMILHDPEIVDATEELWKNIEAKMAEVFK